MPRVRSLCALLEELKDHIWTKQTQARVLRFNMPPSAYDGEVAVKYWRMIREDAQTIVRCADEAIGRIKAQNEREAA
jgi:hypothetical protein